MEDWPLITIIVDMPVSAPSSGLSMNFYNTSFTASIALARYK